MHCECAYISYDCSDHECSGKHVLRIGKFSKSALSGIKYLDNDWLADIICVIMEFFIKSNLSVVNSLINRSRSDGLNMLMVLSIITDEQRKAVERTDLLSLNPSLMASRTPWK